jgi:hypothetical protein
MHASGPNLISSQVDSLTESDASASDSQGTRRPIGLGGGAEVEEAREPRDDGYLHT